jgi:hypothetical protein
LGVTGLIMLLVSFLVPFQTVDIHVHDRYFVFEMSYAFRNTACFLLALFTIYTFLQQMLYSIVLTWVHTFLSILTAATCIFFLYRASQAFHPNFSDWTSFQTNNTVIVICLMTFLLGQALLIVNLLIGAFKRQRG